MLLQMFMGEKFGRDSIWESHLSAELWQTDVALRAVLDEFELPLGEVMQWKVGDFLPLQVTPESKVRMRCGDVSMFAGPMGRKNGHIAVRIENKAAREGDV
jgi:flagellar motor switch protein FliM